MPLWRKFLNFVSWVYCVITSTKHLEETIQNYLRGRSEPLIQVSKSLFLVNSFDIANQILTDDEFNQKGIFDRKYGAYSFQPFVLQQLTDDEEWKRYAPLKLSFEKGKTSEVTPISFRHTSQSLQSIDKKKVDLLCFVRKISLRIACNMTFGYEISENDFSAIHAGVTNLDDYVKRRAIMSLHDRNKFKATVEKLIENFKTNENTGISQGRSTSFLQVLMKENSLEFSHEVLVQYVCTVLLSSFTIQVNDLVCHLIAVLNEHPDVCSKVRQEISEKFHHRMSHEEVNSLAYLNKVVKETMRMFPLNPLLGRTVVTSCTVDGQTVPKGCEVVISCPALQQLGWENPNMFDPERFSHPKKGAYMPFGVGKRACPAGNFGVLAAKSILVYLLKHKNIYTLNGFEHIRSLWYGVPVIIVDEEMKQDNVPSVSTSEDLWTKTKHLYLAKVLPIVAWIDFTIVNKM